MPKGQQITQHTCCVEGAGAFPRDWPCLMAFLRRFLLLSLTLQSFRKKVCQLNSELLIGIYQSCVLACPPTHSPCLPRSSPNILGWQGHEEEDESQGPPCLYHDAAAAAFPATETPDTKAKLHTRAWLCCSTGCFVTSWGPPPATFCHLHEGPKYSPGEGDRGQAEPPDSALPQHTQGSLESCSRKLCSDYLGLHLSPEQISVLLEVPEGGLALNMDQTLPGVPLEEPGAGTWELSQTLHAPSVIKKDCQLASKHHGAVHLLCPSWSKVYTQESKENRICGLR